MNGRPLSRSRRVLTFALLGAGGALSGSLPFSAFSEQWGSPQPTGDRVTAEALSRAVAGYDSLDALLYESETGLYRFSDAGQVENGGYAYCWPFSAALILGADMFRLTGHSRYLADFNQRLGGLDRYRDTRPLSSSLSELGNPLLSSSDDYVRYGCGLRPEPGLELAFSNNYFDDNAFVALSILSMFNQTRDPQLLQMVTRIFNYGLKGVHWTHPSAPGGIVWIEQPEQPAARDMTANTNLCFGILAARLHEITREPWYLEQARALYRWTTETLSSSRGLLADRLTTLGLVADDQNRWSYVSGLQIGLAMLLHRLTAEVSYLDQARMANARASAFFSMRSLVEAQAPAFNSVYFRMRLFAGATLGDQSAVEAVLSEMAMYSDLLWASSAFDRSVGLFRFSGSPEQVLEHSAMLQIAAMQGMDRGHYAHLI